MSRSTSAQSMRNKTQKGMVFDFHNHVTYKSNIFYLVNIIKMHYQFDLHFLVKVTITGIRTANSTIIPMIMRMHLHFLNFL